MSPLHTALARPSRWRARVACVAAAGLVAGAAAGSAAQHSAAVTGSRTPAQNATQRAEALVARMTLAQKITEVHGLQDADHQRYVPGIPSLGIPPLVITNGPAGVGPGDDPAQQPATALPAPIALAASFDPSLANQYGRLIGKEAADLGNNLVEGPDVNIIRIPEAGRTFESFSEDPLLTRSIGTAEIQGIQAQPGMIAEVKHFDAYEQETYRNTPQDDNIVSNRVLHEIYDPPFQQAITRGGAQTLMCSYATVNGEYSCQDPYLLSATVDQRWGFDGFIQSDFSATHSTVPSALAGLDLEMPTGVYYTDPLEQAVLDGQVPMATLNQMLVTRFAAMIRQGLFAHPVTTSPIPAQADGAFSLTAARSGAGPVTLAPGQSVTENWKVSVPVAAQGATATLTAGLTQWGRAVGNLTTSATVTVNPALAVSASTALLSAGGQTTATLSMTSNLPGPAVLHYSASPSAGVTVTPAQGSVIVPANGATVTIGLQAAPAQPPGSYPVLVNLSFTGQGHWYSLSPSQIPVVVPYGSVAASFSNTGISNDTDTNAASFDGDGASFSAQALASVGVTPGASLTCDGITFAWPDVAAGQPDNVVGSGQTIAVTGPGTELGLLDSSTYGVSSGSGTIIYTDGSTQAFSLSVDDWYRTAPAGSNAVIVGPYRNTPGNVQDPTVTNVFEQSIPLQPGKTVAAVTLPDISSAAAEGVTTLHVFAIAIGGGSA